MRALDDLIAKGEALIEARKNPEDARNNFADFGEAYDRWQAAAKDLIRRLSGRAAAARWSSGGCRSVYRLDLDPAACLKEQQRRQALLVELRDDSAAAPPPPATGGPRSVEAVPFAGGSAPTAPRPVEQRVPPVAGQEPPSGEILVPGCAQKNYDNLFVLKPRGKEVADETLLEDLRRVAHTAGTTTVRCEVEYARYGQFTPAAVIKRFGSWNKALKAAGLEVGARRGIPTEELFENLAAVWGKLGRPPAAKEMVKPLSVFSSGPYHARFGSWRPALKAFVAWANEGTAPDESASRLTDEDKGPRFFPSLKLRFQVFQRDNFKCISCGRSPATHPGIILNADHILAWTKGGHTVLENLTALCQECNQGKGNRVCQMPNAPAIPPKSG